MKETKKTISSNQACHAATSWPTPLTQIEPIPARNAVSPPLADIGDDFGSDDLTIDERRALIDDCCQQHRAMGYGVDPHTAKLLHAFIQGKLDIMALCRQMKQPYLH